MSTKAEVISSLNGLNNNLQELSRQVISLRESFSNNYKRLDNAVGSISKLKKLFKEYKSEIKELKKKGNDVCELEDIVNEIDPLIRALNQRLVPATGSLFVRLFLGRVNVKVYKDGERFRLKSEYEKFRSRTNPLLIFLCSMQLIFPRAYLLQGLFQVWLIYYYCTLALREQILRVNGSNINRWWIFHHYFSILASTICLTWPCDSSSYEHFYPIILKFGVFQGLVQILMNRYQIGRLYNLVARGEASRMDVAAEIVDSRFVVSMGVLVPFLTLMNFFQMYMSYSMIQYFIEQHYSQWQVVVLGVLFGIFALGNIWTTLGTTISKKFRGQSQYTQK